MSFGGLSTKVGLAGLVYWLSNFESFTFRVGSRFYYAHSPLLSPTNTHTSLPRFSSPLATWRSFGGVSFEGSTLANVHLDPKWGFGELSDNTIEGLTIFMRFVGV
jgi:hypothetical protein